MKNLVISNLTQQYTYGAVGIQNISLECDSKEIVSIYAKEEGGKTSLLKAVANLCPIVSGDIFINGKSISTLKPKDLDILLIHQDGGLFKRRSVYYNMSFPLRIRKVDRKDIKERVTNIAYQLGIAHLLDAKIYTLTPAQKIKVSFSRALLRTSSVYLIDNLFQSAPPQERHQLFMELLPLIKGLQGAVLFATDSIDEARTVSDRAFILNYGYVVDSGNFADIINHPDNYISYTLTRNYADNTLTATVNEGTELTDGVEASGTADETRIVEQLADGAELTEGTELADETQSADGADLASGTELTEGIARATADEAELTEGTRANGTFIEILGKRIYLDENRLIHPIYIGKDITVCFQTVPSDDEKGIRYDFDFIEYHSDTVIMHSRIANTKIKTPLPHAFPLPKAIKIDPNTLKLFDLNTTKNIYN